MNLLLRIWRVGVGVQMNTQPQIKQGLQSPVADGIMFVSSSDTDICRYNQI